MKNEKESQRTVDATDLLQIDKKTEEKDSSFSKQNFSIQGKFLHIKVGNEQRPVGDVEIDALQKKFDDYIQCNNIDCLVFVTHHAVEISVI